MTRREEKNNARLFEAAPRRLRLEIDLHAELFEEICAPGRRGDGAVAVLCDGHVERGKYQRRDGRNIECREAVSARPAGIEQRRGDKLDPCRVTTHDAHRCGELFGGLTLHLQRDRKRADLSVVRFAPKKYLHRSFHELWADITERDGLPNGFDELQVELPIS